MLGKLKNAVGGNMVQKAVDQFAPMMSEQLQKVQSLDAETITNDDAFTDKVIKPAQLAVAASSGGVTSMIPQFKEKFARALLHVRDELIEVNEGKVALVEDYQSRLPSVLVEGFKG